MPDAQGFPVCFGGEHQGLFVAGIWALSEIGRLLRFSSS